MIQHNELSDSDLRVKLHNREIKIGGNSKLKIYGSLKCKSGKRMRREHRVFFNSVVEAQSYGYRPCGNCMRDQYLQYQLNTKTCL
jgi:methylphosphotriester-DNA--protein-cysteine methyltransferase